MNPVIPTAQVDRDVPRTAPGADHGGFTLIELLVVIAIIAVLISLLLPALKKAREAGRQVACASNQREIGQAFYMYANDNGGYFPLAVDQTMDRWKSNKNAYWSWDIRTYLNNPPMFNKPTPNNVYWCPSYPITINDWFDNFTSYCLTLAVGVNGEWHRIDDIAPNHSGRTMATRIETGPSGAGIMTAAHYGFWHPSHHAIPRHSGGSNFLYLDGHVEYHRANTPDNPFPDGTFGNPDAPR